MKSSCNEYIIFIFVLFSEFCDIYKNECSIPEFKREGIDNVESEFMRIKALIVKDDYFRRCHDHFLNEYELMKPLLEQHQQEYRAWYEDNFMDALDRFVKSGNEYSYYYGLKGAREDIDGKIGFPLRNQLISKKLLSGLAKLFEERAMYSDYFDVDVYDMMNKTLLKEYLIDSFKEYFYDSNRYNAYDLEIYAMFGSVKNFLSSMYEKQEFSNRSIYKVML